MRAGEGGESLWARMGVVVSGGSVKTADMRDAGTQAQGLKRRKGWSYQKNIAERIREAIRQKHHGHYNELTVENPTVAGFYINTDTNEATRTRRSNVLPVREIIPFIKELSMPLYAMREGELYETTYADDTEEGFIIKENVPPHEIAARTFHLDDAKRERLLEDILEDSPFKIESPEVGYVQSRTQGKETYIEISAPKNIQNLKGERRIYRAADREISTLSNLGGREVKQIAEFSGIGSNIQYLVTENILYRRQENIHTKEVLTEPIRRFDPLDLGYISIGFSTHNLERPVQDTEAYLSGMEQSIKKLLQERTEWEREPDNEKRKRMLAHCDSWIGRLAFHLYGFGEAADQWEDKETKGRAFALAGQMFAEDAYHDILQKRIDEEGRFRITKDDLE